MMNHRVHLTISGLGIVFFSAKMMAHVPPGTDFLEEEFMAPDRIAAHLNRGDITAFCTGSEGGFDLLFFDGQPSAEDLERFPVSVQLGLEIRGGSVQFCDLYWLMNWTTAFPPEQVLPLDDGFYRITACTRLPESGYWGEDQTIRLFFQKVDALPQMHWKGVPDLFTED